ncbi:MAG: homogentisate 1,2-dioxygenase, partial [Myxococcales bacterium]|nr:homogentisate 1,2-dioxygenase [Myxococcales bacterium]
TLGGAGGPALRRGYAIHLYAANHSMDERAFYNADGELLLLPQRGRLTLQTELGALELGPGELAVLPRGLLFSVLLRDGDARGYLAEVYGRRFELPGRGPVGANGLADPRHFRAPVARFEDRLAPGYRVTAKLGGRLFDARQDHAPYDVVAWHGDHVPYVYDLARFSPVGNTRFDHPDPSIFTVLSAPLDEQGAHCLDLVFFPPRWDASERSFRPPFFHRNAVTEINGIIRDASLGAHALFQPGGCFVTPAMTAHGVLARAVERELRRRDETPTRIPDDSAWFQLETALPLHLSRWARGTALRVPGWPLRWGAQRRRFDPDDAPG